MIHEVVDIERWKAMFPLDEALAELQPHAEEWDRESRAWRSEHLTLDQNLIYQLVQQSPVVGPRQFALIEQLRDRMRERIDIGQAVPTDIFIWALGEPERREVTKIGGLPYRRADRPWPLAKDGRRCLFIGQFCFADSVDLLPDLPGDVLLIFAHPEWEGVWSTEDGGLTFEWVRLGERELVAQDDVPVHEFDIVPCYGQIFRTFDYPDLGGNGGWFEGELAEFSGLGLLKASKIGGVPWWEQQDPNLQGRFLGVQESVWQFFDAPYPFVNHPDSIPWRTAYYRFNNALLWGDVGRLYLYLEGDTIRWEVQCG